MLQVESPKVRLEHPPVMWWVSLREKLRKISFPLLVQERGVRLYCWRKRTSHIKDSIQQAVHETVWRASGKFPTASWGGNRAIHEAIRRKIERASVCQNSSEKWCGTINSLPLWCLGLANQYPCSNHFLWAPEAFQVYKRCSKRSISRCRDFLTQIPATCEEKDDNHCHYASKQFSCITFTT